jgi:hypothetical protein
LVQEDRFRRFEIEVVATATAAGACSLGSALRLLEAPCSLLSTLCARTRVLSLSILIALCSGLLLPLQQSAAQETVDAEAPAADTTPLPEKVAAPEESTVFDLYLSDKFQGAVVASYTDEWFEVEDPQDAVTQIGDIKSKQSEVVELLTGRIAKERTVEGVGRVSIDLSTFRIIIQPDSALVQAKSAGLGQQRIGDPEEGLAIHQTFGAAAFNQGLGTSFDNTSAFTHRGVASYGDLFLRTNGFLAQDQPYQMNEATLGTIVDDYQARGGLLQTRGQGYSPTLRFAGLQFETAEFLFLDNEAARGSRFEIFVPSRSTVRFYREGQLLAVQVLDFGLQEVDTSAFPQGSYDVTVVTTDSAGRETTDKRFFTKSGLLASRARPVVYFSAGVVRNVLELLDTPITQAGFRMRVTDYFDFGTGVAATNDNSIASFDMNGLYDVLRLSLDGAVGQSGDHGLGIGSGVTLLGVSVSGRYSRAQGAAAPAVEATPVSALPNFVPGQVNSPTNLIIQQQESASVYMTRSVGPFDLRYNVQNNKIGDDVRRYTRGPSVDWRILSDTTESLQLRVADFDSEQGQLQIAQLFYSYRLSSFWTLNAQVLQRWQEDNDELLALLGSTYNSQLQTGGIGSRTQAMEELRRLKLKDQETDSATTSVISNVTTDLVNLRGFVRDSRQVGEGATSAWGLNAESTFFVSNEGAVDVAHPPQGDCVFVAEVAGNLLTDDDEFDVVVNGQRQGKVSRGARGIISLTPYRTYRVSIEAAEKTGLVDYDAATYEVTLFPGNVVKRVWKVDKVYVLLGTLVDPSGAPIARERVQGAKGYGFTEEDGSFQLEVTGEEPLSVNSKRHKCVFDFTFPESPEYFLDAGEIVCRPVSAEPEGDDQRV